MAEETKKKQRRLKGDKYWELTRKMKAYKKAIKDLNDWQTGEAEKLESYMDLLNWTTGAIFDDRAEIVEGRVKNGKVVGRIPTEVMTAFKDQEKKALDLDGELDEFRNELCKVLNIYPDQIDMETGIIDSTDYEGVDPNEIDQEAEESEEE